MSAVFRLRRVVIPVPVFIPAPVAAPTSRVASRGVSRFLIRIFDAVATWQERARQRHHLEGLDDHLLRDIGLSRADADRETSKPFWQC